jgi:hypothetical protein
VNTCNEIVQISAQAGVGVILDVSISNSTKVIFGMMSTFRAKGPNRRCTRRSRAGFCCTGGGRGLWCSGRAAAHCQGSVEARTSICGEDVVWYRPRSGMVSISLDVIVHLRAFEVVAWRVWLGNSNNKDDE